MSDTTRTILWIALAVVVLALIAWVMASSRRRRAAEERTFKTGELRAQPEPADRPTAAPEQPVAHETQRAVTQPTADAAPEPRAAAAADADSSPAASPAQHHDGTESDVDTPGSQHEVAAAEPDDVATAHDGHDGAPAVGSRTAEQDEQAQGPGRAETRGAGAAAAGAFGGASTLDHDDEPDLADADDPFSSSREPRTPAEPSQEESSSREQSSPNGYEKPMNETSSNAAGGHFDDGRTVSVPALDEAKEALTDGGTPSGDAGDHRGQAWSTSPGSASLDTESGTDERDAVEDIDAPNTAEQPVESARAPEPASGDNDVHAEDTDTDTDADDTDTDSDDAAVRTDDAATIDTDTDTDADDGDADDADGGAVVGRADEGSDDESHHTASGDEQGEATSATNAETTAETTAEATAEGRRISGFDEVSDGGYGLGSAAPIADGAQPLGHPVKAWHDRKSFVGPDDEGYDGSEPDVWFYSADAARRAGFSGPGD